MHYTARQKADTGSQTKINGALPGTERVTNKSATTVKFCPLPWMVGAICDLSEGAKGLFAKLNFDAWGRSWCRVGVGSLANSLGTERVIIRRWAKELEQRGLIRVRHERACCVYYLNPKCRVGGFIPLLAETMKRRDVGWAYKLLLCCLSYRQKGNDYCWAKQKDIADELGVSLRTIQRLLAAMKAKGEVQIRLRGNNRKQGNKYALTCGAVLGGRIFGSNSHTTESTHLYKKWSAKSYLKALRPEILSWDLSKSGFRGGFGPDEVYLKLINIGIHEKVAQSQAFDQRHPFESVDQAENNGLIKRAAVFKRSDDAGLPRPKFNLAGYVVAALNGARREGKIVGTTKLFRKAATMHSVLKMAKARQGIRKRPSAEEFERRKQKLIKQIRKMQNETC